MPQESERVRAIRNRVQREVGVDPLPGRAGDPRRSIVPLKPHGATKPLFLVPGQRGDLFHFKRTVERIREDIPIYGFESRGIHGDVDPFRDLTEMARYYVQELRSVQPRGPHLLAGFSVGGKIVYEMARLLEAEGDPPHLLIFDYGPNRYGPPRTGPLNHLLRPIRRWSFHGRNYRGLEGPRRAAYRREEIYQDFRGMAWAFGFKPKAWVRRLRRRPTPPSTRVRLPGAAVTRVALRDAEGSWSGWDKPPFRSRFTLFRGIMQQPGSRGTMQLGFDQETAPGGVDVRPIPGFHGFMFAEPHLFTLIAELEDWVDRVTDAPVVSPVTAASAPMSVPAAGPEEPPSVPAPLQ